MSKVEDGRVSKFQRQIYDWLIELYPTLGIEMEKLIPSTNQRIDIFIPYLNIAVECDGTFHDSPDSFFVKDQASWADIIERDKRKEKDLYHSGIKLVRIPYKHKLKSSKDLQEYMESIPDSIIDYDGSIFESKVNVNEEKFKTKIKSQRKESYLQYKEDNKEDLKSKNKLAYKKMKERLKENKKEDSFKVKTVSSKFYDIPN